MLCSYTRPRYQVSVFRTIGPLVSHFGFEGGTLVLIAPVPGHRILVTFVREILRLALADLVGRVPMCKKRAYHTFIQYRKHPHSFITVQAKRLEKSYSRLLLFTCMPFKSTAKHEPNS